MTNTCDIDMDYLRLREGVLAEGIPGDNIPLRLSLGTVEPWKDPR
jgi:hypothetical protein